MSKIIIDGKEYEGNSLEINGDGEVFIDGKKASDNKVMPFMEKIMPFMEKIMWILTGVSFGFMCSSVVLFILK